MHDGLKHAYEEKMRVPPPPPPQSKYDEEVSQSQVTDQPMVLRERETRHGQTDAST